MFPHSALVLVICTSLFLSAISTAGPLTVGNPGFEEPALPDGSSLVGVGSPWTVDAGTLVPQPLTENPAGAGTVSLKASSESDSGPTRTLYHPDPADAGNYLRARYGLRLRHQADRLRRRRDPAVSDPARRTRGADRHERRADRRTWQRHAIPVSGPRRAERSREPRER
jgi:hypothetical protein